MVHTEIQALHDQILHLTGDSTIIAHDSSAAYMIDDVAPELVISPKSADHVSTVLKSANTAGASVISWGGGTKVRTGFMVHGYTIALDMNKQNEIKEYEPADLTVIAEAGMTLTQLNEVLAEHNQFVALNPPLPDKTTIGGILASNSYGFLREEYGTARDMTLGIKFVRSDGTQVKGGGKVAKNVAGYDLTRLMIGSWGTLGIITEAAFRVRPLPEIRTTFIAGFATLSKAADAAFAILNSYFTPSFLVLINRTLGEKFLEQRTNDIGAAQYVFVIGIDGIADTAAWQAERIKDTCKRYNVILCEPVPETESQRIRTILRDYPSDEYRGIVCKIVTTRTGAVGLLEFIERNFHENDHSVGTVSSLGSGVVHVFIPNTTEHDDKSSDRIKEKITELQEFVKKENGFCVFEHAPVWLKELCSVWQGFPGEALMRKIKKQLDPNNILNPERYIRSAKMLTLVK